MDVIIASSFIGVCACRVEIKSCFTGDILHISSLSTRDSKHSKWSLYGNSKYSLNCYLFSYNDDEQYIGVEEQSDGGDDGDGNAKRERHCRLLGPRFRPVHLHGAGLCLSLFCF